jgi:hypothetical protein
MDCVEKMVTKYINKLVYGVRADYFRKVIKSSSNIDCVDRLTKISELSISKSTATCGPCAVCPNNKLCEALDELTEKQRFIVTKIYFEELAEHEVGTILGITQQAVHFNKIMALKKLRNILPNPK